MQKFAVKIDLSTFFDDERKYVLILVDPQWENVECLQQRVQQIFDVDSVGFQTNDNYFIPPQESIEVLKFTNSLKAFIPKKSLEKSRRKSKKSIRIEAAEEQEKRQQDRTEWPPEELSVPVEEELLKKRKYYSCGTGLISSTPNQPKRLKQTQPLGALGITAPVVSSKSHEITSTSEQKDGKVAVAAADVPLLMSEEMLTDEQTSEKRKRKRVRKSKKNRDEHHNASVTDDQMNSEQSTNAEQCSRATMNSAPPSSTFLSRSTHIRHGISDFMQATEDTTHCHFSESGDLVSTTTAQEFGKGKKFATENGNTEAVKVIFRCSLDDIEAQKPRIFRFKTLNGRQKKPEIQIQENLLLPSVGVDLVTEPVVNTISSALDSACAVEVITAPNQTTESSQKLASTLETQVETKATEVTAESNVKENDFENVPNDANAVPANAVSDDSQYVAKDTTVDVTNRVENTGESGLSESSLLDESNIIDLDDEDEKAESNSEVIDLSENDAENQTSCRSNTINGSTSKDATFDPTRMTAQEMLPYSTELERIPNLGDILIFKFYRQNSAGQRKTSNFISGKCEYINKRTKTIKIALIDIEAEKDRIPAQFAYNLDDSSVEKYLNIKFTDMVDPRVIET